jgi:hypothetical protein
VLHPDRRDGGVRIRTSWSPSYAWPARALARTLGRGQTLPRTVGLVFSPVLHKVVESLIILDTLHKLYTTSTNIKLDS